MISYIPLGFCNKFTYFMKISAKTLYSQIYTPSPMQLPRVHSTPVPRRRTISFIQFFMAKMETNQKPMAYTSYILMMIIKRESHYRNGNQTVPNSYKSTPVRRRSAVKIVKAVACSIAYTSPKKKFYTRNSIFLVIN